ncbi:chromate transporter [Natranaerobius trueperi]|uniref:Chromate transporter n=1 Tax=Natranaerobius trueperi TaxID=759412 RepID=A0A226C1G6_9FIRM|nr:chromate transporter [Natranaerobius trueperi]OWZ84454.1 chromate transporter [Natranaerobius trueperi]
MIIVQLFFSFLKIGFFSFGGGYVMIPLIKEKIITDKGWLSSSEFIDVIAIAEMTPGPIAINSATFVGYQVAGLSGAISSTLGVITPSVILILISAKFLLKYYQKPYVKNFFQGVRPAIIGLVLSAGIIIGRSAIIDFKGLIIASIVFFVMVFKKPNPIMMIMVSAIIGIIVY